MLRLKKNNFIKLSILLFGLTISCKKYNEKSSKSELKNIKIEDSLSNLTDYITGKDTIKICVDLSMEWWIRKDEIILTRKNDHIQIQAIIKEDTTFEMRYQMRTNKLSVRKLKNVNNEFEKYFVNKLERVNIEPGRYIYKIMSSSDTLEFYTNGLGDKGGEIQDYYKFMTQYYPNEKDFIPIEVIQEDQMP